MSRSSQNWRNSPERNLYLHSNQQTDGGFGKDNYGDNSLGPQETILPDTCHPDSTNLSNAEANLSQVIRWENYLIYPPHPPGSLYPALWANYVLPFPSYGPPNYPYELQRPSTSQATGHTTNQTRSYFGFNPNYLQHPARVELQLANGFQGQGFYPNHNTDDLEPPPFAPVGQPERRGRQRGKTASYSNHGPHACYICGIRCKRQTDLDRHLKTTRKHADPHGPVCPEPRCNHTARFTRIDNFKAHYRKQHGKNDDEATEFIQEWKARGRP